MVVNSLYEQVIKGSSHSQVVVAVVLSCGWRVSSETDGKCLAFGNCVLFLKTTYRNWSFLTRKFLSNFYSDQMWLQWF